MRPGLVAAISVVIHVCACLALLASRGGTEIVSDLAARQAWILIHTSLWIRTWLVWALASASLVALTVVWTRHLVRLGVPRGWALLGCGLVALGLPFDLVGESVNIVWATRPQSLADFAAAVRAYQLVSVAVANGLYCLGGLILSVLSWRAGWLRGPMAGLGFVMWSVGLGLTVAAILEHGPAMAITGAAVMSLYLIFAAWLGWRFPRGTGLYPAENVTDRV
jgi:hypothetical protein